MVVKNNNTQHNEHADNRRHKQTCTNLNNAKAGALSSPYSEPKMEYIWEENSSRISLNTIDFSHKIVVN